MKNHLWSVLTTIGLMLFVLAPSTSEAGLFGPKSFEECVAEEMKGRPMAQLSLVRASCGKRFPALLKFMNLTAIGNIKCSNTYRALNIDISIDKQYLTLGSYKFEVTQRTREKVRAIKRDGNEGDPIGRGSLLTLDFELGEAVLVSSADRSTVDLECQATP